MSKCGPVNSQSVRAVVGRPDPQSLAGAHHRAPCPPAPPLVVRIIITVGWPSKGDRPPAVRHRCGPGFDRLPARLTRSTVTRDLHRVWLVLVGILSVQFGAGIAKDLFDQIDPTAMVWLRLVTSALVLLAIARPALRGAHPRGLAGGRSAFGVTLGLMNWAIYQSFARIPLGIAVTIEFVGPLAIAVHRLPAGPGPGLGGAGRGRRRPARLRARRRQRRRRPVRAARRRQLGGVHPAERETGRRWPGPGRARGGERARHRAADARRRSHGGGTLLDPRDPGARRGGRPAQLGDPLQLRDGRAAAPSGRRCSAS